MEVEPRDIQRYSTPDGKVPFSEWLDSLRDLKAKFKIDRRLDELGLEISEIIDQSEKVSMS